jgi:hypothetical protein
MRSDQHWSWSSIVNHHRITTFRISLCKIEGLMGRRLGLFVALQFLLTPITAAADDLAVWKIMLQGCIDIVTTGTTEGSQWHAVGPAGPACAQIGGGSVCDLTAQRMAFGNFAQIEVLTPMIRSAEGIVTACRSRPHLPIAGNDAAGLALRAASHDVADARLNFHPEDQYSFPDVWRGCAFDGREFRLTSVTQMSRAYFAIMLSPRSRACAFIGS